jgi:hypothetical protein
MWRRHVSASVIALLAAGCASTRAVWDRPTLVRVAVIGDAGIREPFIKSLEAAGRHASLHFELVPRPNADYTLLIAQDTTIGSAAAAVTALDRRGDVALSIVRSGRITGRGALDACAKQLAKDLARLFR